MRSPLSRAGHSLFLGLALSLTGAACGGSVAAEPAGAPASVPESEAGARLAETYCKTLFSCHCAEPPYADEAACRADVVARHEARAEGSRAAGLVYDGTCVAAEIARIEALGCVPYARYFEEHEGCEAACYEYHGTVPEGEYCGNTSPFSDCVQGSDCNPGEGGDGRCHPVCPVTNIAADGQACVSESGGIIASCQEGSDCDYGSGLCVHRPGEGAPCPLDECEEGLFCTSVVQEPEPVCAPRAADGAACVNAVQCESFGCNDGVCGPGEAYFCIVSAP